MRLLKETLGMTHVMRQATKERASDPFLACSIKDPATYTLAKWSPASLTDEIASIGAGCVVADEHSMSVTNSNSTPCFGKSSGLGCFATHYSRCLNWIADGTVGESVGLAHLGNRRSIG